MSLIIDSTYLEGGKLKIPNAVSNASITGNVPTAATNIDNYIDKYEEQFLKNAIGYTNYQSLSTAIGADPTLVNPSNAIWNDLVNGKVYSYEGMDVEWKGLKQVYGTIKHSLIANFVFYHYLTDDVSDYTTTGVQSNTAENATGQSPNLLLTQVWREFIELYQYGYDTCPKIITNSWGVTGVDWYQSQNNSDRSLYQFLRDNDNYGAYNFFLYDNRNVLGI